MAFFVFIKIGYSNFMSLSQKTTCSILILATIFYFSFGVATMNMDENGNMFDCPFADSATICLMDFSEHIATFQGIFRAIPSKIVLLLILVLAYLLILYSKSIPRIYSPPNNLDLVVKNSLEIPIFNKLLLAFSDGIIQPKLYA